KYFSSFFTVAPENYADLLAEKMPRLQTLTISASHPQAAFGEFRGMERFPRLEAFNLPWGTRTSVEELLKAPHLKILAFNNSGLAASGRGFARYPELAGLIDIRN